MNRLAQGNARVMPKLKVSDLVIVKPRWARMLGSQPPIPGGRAEKRDKADHRGDDPPAIAAEDDADRIAADVGETVGDERFSGGRAAEPHPLQKVEGAPALAVGDEPARQFGQCKAEQE